MKIAHLILAHNHPAQLERLVKRLIHPDADLFIHLDIKTDSTPYQHLADLPGVTFITNRVSVVWGEYSVIQATLNGMRQILATGTTFSHINLLSGNDYPLKSADEIQRFFFANTGRNFMWYDAIFPAWPDGQARINGYNFGDYGFPGRYLLGNLVNKILPNRKMPDGMVAYGRAQWITITPEAAAYTLDYINSHARVKKFLFQTWCVDEVFFQTILCNSPFLSTISTDNKRYVRLDPQCIPVTFTIDNAEELAKSGKFYARKFNMELDSAIFDLMDNLSK